MTMPHSERRVPGGGAAREAVLITWFRDERGGPDGGAGLSTPLNAQRVQELPAINDAFVGRIVPETPPPPLVKHRVKHPSRCWSKLGANTGQNRYH